VKRRFARWSLNSAFPPPPSRGYNAGMSEERKKPGVAFWATVVVVVVLAYPLSLGPACWVSSRMNAGESTVSSVYRPLTLGMSKSERIAAAIDWYSALDSANDWAWVELDVANTATRNWQLRPSPVGGMF